MTKISFFFQYSIESERNNGIRNRKQYKICYNSNNENEQVIIKHGEVNHIRQHVDEKNLCISIVDTGLVKSSDMFKFKCKMRLENEGKHTSKDDCSILLCTLNNIP